MTPLKYAEEELDIPRKGRFSRIKRPVDVRLRFSIDMRAQVID